MVTTPSTIVGGFSVAVVSHILNVIIGSLVYPDPGFVISIRTTHPSDIIAVAAASVPSPVITTIGEFVYPLPEQVTSIFSILPYLYIQSIASSVISDNKSPPAVTLNDSGETSVTRKSSCSPSL